MNNDELQKAIDDITKDNVPAETAPTDVAPAPAEELVEQNPVPEAVPAPEPTPMPEVDLGTAPAPVVPAEPSMPPTVDIPERAPIAESAPAAASFVEDAPAPAGSDSTLEEAMRELYPLLDRVDMPVEDKFDITIKYGEPAKALDLAKQFTDETAKAKALLEIVNKLK